MTSERAVEPTAYKPRWSGSPNEAADKLFDELSESPLPGARHALDVVRRRLPALFAATPAPQEDGWEEPELRRWTERVTDEKAWTRQELAELVEFSQRLFPRLAAARGEPPIDVEQLAAALDSVDIDEFDTLGAFDSTGYATAILAALPDVT